MEKRCTGCKEVKPAKLFSKNKNTQDGYEFQCKTCRGLYFQSSKGKAAKKRYRESDKGKEVSRRGTAKYHQSTKGKEAKKRYAQSPKGKAVARHSSIKYYESNKTKTKEAKKAFWQSPKGKAAKKGYSSKRRTLKTQAGGSFTSDQWYKLCEFYNFQCLKCKKQFPLDKLVADHVKPVAKGGSSFIWNIQPLCARCNSKKHDAEIDYRKTLPDWMDQDGPVWQQGELF